MMYGTREVFNYLECGKCGCLQIIEIPGDIEKYYPEKTYYSLKKENGPMNFLKYIINKRDEYCLFHNNYLGKLINFKYPNSFFSILGKLNLNYDSRILDIGCGSGKFLFKLKELEFKNLYGIDPNIHSNIINNNLRIYKKTLEQLSDSLNFDFVFFKHSFEHLDNPFENLFKVKKILNSNGKCIISMPIKTDYIWNKYHENWVQIDAPRHFFIHSLESLKILMEKSGFSISKIYFDSTEFQFWGSEQYKYDIPLESDISYKINPKKSIFTKSQIKRFKSDSESLNDRHLGDQAVFVLELKNES